MIPGLAATLPYCGAPPLPEALWSRWNLDPALILGLLALAALYAAGAGKAGIGGGRRALFAAGWVVTALALLSPLCALSVSLFAARVGQHMVLALAAAPLVAAGRPVAAFTATVGLRAPRPQPAPIAAGLAFAGLIWLWHAPLPYAATFESDAIYWAMHLTTFAAAVWLWTALIDHGERLLAAALAALGAAVQMGLLGALITFAPRPLYAPHLATTIAWGLSPLQDQQLGGAIMWVPGCVVFLAVTLLSLRRMLVGTAGAAFAARP